MPRWIRQTLLCLPLILMMVGCLSLQGSVSTTTFATVSDKFEVSERSQLSSAGCRYEYRVYEPKTPSTTTSIVLGHGFLRDQDNMRGLSSALAERGVRVITLDFCNMRVWNGHHQRNAYDMRSLAGQLGIDHDVVFAGFSAGALAAVLAADDNTRAILALDMVDQGNQGLKAIKELSTPLIGLAGPASSCNANGNANAIFDARPDTLQSSLTRLQGINHCDFEAPSNWLCEIVCAGNERSHTQIASDRTNIIMKSIEALLPYLNRYKDFTDT